MSEKLEAIVIGSGFGGSIATCRLSKKWPGKVMLLERGKRYPMGSFPRSPHNLSLNFWNVAGEMRRRPRKIPKGELHGMFDIRRGRHMDVVLSAGLGGGSLIYANVFLMPPDHVFDERWPVSCNRQSLLPYYQVAKDVLGARPVPRNDDPRRRIRRTELFEQSARKLSRTSSLLDINVFFGNDFNSPLSIGLQDENRYGIVQTSCVYCGECDIGCNYHAKNTLDLNYLFVAENRYKATICTEHMAEKIVPIDEQDNDNSDANGSYGYRIYYRDLGGNGHSTQSILAKRVILSAGTLGTCELLLRARRDESLRRLNTCLGQHFSGNGDFLSFVMGTREPADPNYGPVITQAIDYNLLQNFQPDRAFLMEDASYPNLAAWFVEGFRPPTTLFEGLSTALRRFYKAWRRGIKSMGLVFSDVLSQDLSYHTCVLLCMGLDKSNGVLSLDKAGYVDVDWPYKGSMALYDAILDAGKEFQRTVEGKYFFPLPTWINCWLLQWWRRNITVHPLGGCILATNPSEGVVSAEESTFGQVFGYIGLYIADGSIVPTAVGANPTAVISALAERIAERITEIPPDAKL